MPLTNNVQKNVAELMRDNNKKGRERGNKGTPRSKAQIIAISYAAAKKK